MAKRADTSVGTFLRENPEYNLMRAMEQIPKMENVPLREGAPSSLAAVRKQVPHGQRFQQANKQIQDAYSKWARRRSGALSYQSQPSVSEHLGDVQRQYDTGLSELEGSEDTGDPGDTGDWEDTGGFEDTGGPFYDAIPPISTQDIANIWGDAVRRSFVEQQPDWLSEWSDAIDLETATTDEKIEYNKARADHGLEPLAGVPGSEEESSRAQELRNRRRHIPTHQDF